MAHHAPTALALWRRAQVEHESGLRRSTLYVRIGQGLWTRPVRLGPNSVAWPAAEVAALNTARISGKTDDEIRALVVELEQARTTTSLGIAESGSQECSVER